MPAWMLRWNFCAELFGLCLDRKLEETSGCKTNRRGRGAPAGSLSFEYSKLEIFQQYLVRYMPFPELNAFRLIAVPQRPLIALLSFDVNG